MKHATLSSPFKASGTSFRFVTEVYKRLAADTPAMKYWDFLKSRPRILITAKDRLSPTMQLYVLDFYLSGQSCAEISDSYSVSEEVVRTQLEQAYRIFSDEIGLELRSMFPEYEFYSKWREMNFPNRIITLLESRNLYSYEDVMTFCEGKASKLLTIRGLGVKTAKAIAERFNAAGYTMVLDFKGDTTSNSTTVPNYTAVYLADYALACKNVSWMLQEPIVYPNGDILRRDIVLPRKINGLPVLVYPITNSDGLYTDQNVIAWDGTEGTNLNQK